MSTVAEIEKLGLALDGIEKKLYPQLAEQAAQIKQYGETKDKHATKIQRLEDKHDAMERELKEMMEDFKAKLDGMDKVVSRSGGLVTPGSPEWYGEKRAPSLGKLLTESDRFKNWDKSGNMEGAVEIKAGDNPFLRHKDITGDGPLRSVFATERLQRIFNEPLRAARVRDLFPVIPTTANVITYLVETLFDNQADGWIDGSDDEKPESSFVFDDAEANVRTLAHWTPISRNLLMDVPALLNYINLRLIEGLMEVEDRQILYGDNSANSLYGIMVLPNVQEFNQSDGEPTDTKIDTLRRAMTRAQLAYYSVDGFVLNPLDWEDIELAKSTTGMYIWVNVATGAQPQLWKVPIVATTAMDAGDYLTGSFGSNAAIWDREQARMRVTDSHGIDFIKNRLAVLVERRLALTVFRPPAFVRGVFDGAPLS